MPHLPHHLLHDDYLSLPPPRIRPCFKPQDPRPPASLCHHHLRFGVFWLPSSHGLFRFRTLPRIHGRSVRLRGRLLIYAPVINPLRATLADHPYRTVLPSESTLRKTHLCASAALPFFIKTLLSGLCKSNCIRCAFIAYKTTRVLLGRCDGTSGLLYSSFSTPSSAHTLSHLRRRLFICIVHDVGLALCICHARSPCWDE